MDYQKKALEVFKKSDNYARKVLEEVFGADHFRQSIFSRVTGMDDVYREKGLNISIDKSLSAFEKVEMMTDVVNEGWIPDYSNAKEEKWFLIFKYVPGSGWVLSGCGRECTSTDVGARLVFKTKKHAEHAAQYFMPQFNDFLTKK